MSDINQDLLGFLTKVSAILTQQNCPAYVVGGFVRDWLLDRQTADVDIAVCGDALSIAQDVAEAVDGRYVLLDEANRVARVVVADEQMWHLDFSSFSDGIQSDLARRDFTIDAMAVELQGVISGSAQLIDPFSGESDLKERLVRAVNQRIFVEDGARLLRGVRLAGELGFRIEPGTESLIRRDCRKAKLVSGERLREEMVRILALPGSGEMVRYLDELGLLTEIVPELKELKGAEQPKEHYWDVFDHSVEAMAAAEFLLRESLWKYGKEDLLKVTPWSEEISRHFDEEVSSGSNRRLMLKLGALLHDIAKPATRTVDETGRTRFLGHAKQGAAMAVGVLERLRFSSREIRLVENLVYHHLRPAQMSNEGLPTSRAVYRYFRDTEDAGIDVLFVALADYLATHGPRLDIEEWQQHNQLIGYILAEHVKQEAEILPVRLIDGHDLMDIFGLSPGRLIGELLTEVREAQVAGELSTREEAIALVRKELGKRQCGMAC
ncbi:MAG: HD domain-containing protein [Chloroflexi bacterium]|nr:HD domain-containing protein [Chloroflexota bacterium]MBL7061224.1 HD domain-containing protein [Dehalococcoidia bacterium]